jgi:tetratricopeptide (TPR) repeat protein
MSSKPGKPHLAPPATDKAGAALRERLRGLAPPQAEILRRVMRLHAEGDRLGWVQWLLLLEHEAPAHPEVRLWQALRHRDAGDWTAAVASLQQVVAARPGDFGAWCLLGSAQGQAGDLEAAGRSLARAATLARSAADWMRLSLDCDAQGLFEPARAAADRWLALDPGSPPGRLQRARCHKMLGEAEAAATDCRALIARGQELPRAWFALVDLKTAPLTPAERALLAQTAARPGWSAELQALLEFALGQALEQGGELDAALAAFGRANARIRATLPWNAALQAGHAQALHDVLGRLPAGDSAQGEEIIFLVGLPRSGSTLVEQVLASHPLVEGASELPYLPQIIEAESRRRARAFPAWAADATPEDWARLGRQYLDASARWRRSRPRSTDKLPDNWQLVGAIRAMLPGARIVDCRRNWLETCWSCYKQLFGPGLAAFSYGFDSLAQQAAACDRFGRFWAERDPGHVRLQPLEALLAEPEPQIRALLAFCGLPFEPACLAPHTTQRAIRTPSALQVRQPMRAAPGAAAAYGERLQPLRAALADVGLA